MDSLIKESGVGGGEAKMRIGEQFQANIPPLKEYTDLKAMGSVVKIDPTNSSAFEIIISGCTFRVLPVFKNGKVDWEYMKVKISSLFFLRFSEKLSEFPVIVLGKGESGTVVGKVVGLMEKKALCSYLNDCVEQDAFFDPEKAFELYNAELDLKALGIEVDDATTDVAAAC